MTKLEFWGPNIAVGILFSTGGLFLLFGAPSGVAVPLQRVNNLLGQKICPEGEQKMFYPQENRIDRCIPKKSLTLYPCKPGTQQVSVVERLEIEGMVTSALDTMCAPRGLNLPQAIRQPLIPTPKPIF